MMKKFVFKYYPIAISLYTMLLLYMLFFAYNRGDLGQIYDIHFLPFNSIINVISTMDDVEIFKNIGGNIVLFMPYGFLGILFPKLNQYKYLFINFFIAINIVEFSQYFFQVGFAEIDDVILNVFGMTLGFLLYRKFKN